MPEGLAYAFISPLFDSISKPGYRADGGPVGDSAGRLPCRPVGLGGVSADTIGLMIARGWTGAALLGWIWEEPREAVSRFEQLKKINRMDRPKVLVVAGYDQSAGAGVLADIKTLEAHGVYGYAVITGADVPE